MLSAFAFLLLYYKMKIVCIKRRNGREEATLIQLIVSVLLYFVIFFGIAFILNMLIRKTWVMAWLYPIVIIMVIDNISTWEYVTSPGAAFSQLGSTLANFTIPDYIILLSGLAGTIVSGLVIKWLRKNGYRMF